MGKYFQDLGVFGTMTFCALASNFGWSLAEKIAIRALPLAAYMVLAVMLSPREFGIVAAAAVVVFFAQTLVDGVISQYIVQRSRVKDSVLVSALCSVLCLAIILASTMLLIAPLVAVVWPYDELTLVIQVLSFRVLLMGIGSLPQAILVRRQEFRVIATVSLAASFLSSATAITMAFLGFGVWSLVAQTLVMSSVQVASNWCCCGWAPRGKVRLKYVVESAKFGAANIGTNLANTLNQRADEVLVMTFLGPVSLGVYSLAKRVEFVVGGLFTNVFFQVMTTSLSRLQNDMDDFRSLYSRIYRASTWGMSLIAIVMCINVVWALPAALGDQWATAGYVAAALLFASVMHTSSSIDSAATIALGKPQREMAVSTVTAVAQASLVYVFLPLGLVAVGVASVIKAGANVPLRIWLNSRILSTRAAEIAGHFFRCTLLAGVLILGAMWMVASSGLGSWLSVAVSLLCSLVYVACTFEHVREISALRQGMVKGSSRPNETAVH